MGSTDVISSILRASEILKCLSEGIGKISEISRKLQYNKATVHRVLKSLEKIGYAAQDPFTRQYYLGPKLHNLTSNPLNVHQFLIQCAREEMFHLRDIINETVSLQIPQGATSVSVETVETKQSIRLFMKKGSSTPIYTGAVGKVLLSQFDDEELSTILEKIELNPVTKHTITDEDVLLKDLVKARKEGYALTFEEYTEGAGALAVPIKNYTCPVALWIAGPRERIKENYTNLLVHLKNSAATISKKLDKTVYA